MAPQTLRPQDLRPSDPQDLRPSGRGFCGCFLAAGRAEELADVGHRLFGRRKLAEAGQALGLHQLVFELG